MHPEVSDLLMKAKADAPPARFGVDDVVAAGRRRRRRRNAGWAAAVAGVVAITVGVPQAVTHRADPPIAPPAASLAPPAASLAPPSRVVRPPELTFTVRPYVAGSFRVSEPRGWSLAGETSVVTEVNGGPTTIALLTALRPGVDRARPGPGQTITPTDPIGGRRAYFLRPDDGEPQLVWEYADDALAVLVPMKPGSMSAADMRRVAQGFTRGPAEEVTLGYRVGYVPDGYRLIQVSGNRVQFVPARDAVARLAAPDRVAASGAAIPDIIAIELEEPDSTFGKPSPEPRCEPARSYCYLYTTAGLPAITVNAPSSIPEEQIRTMLEAVTVGTLPVTQAIPEYARMN